MRTQLPTRIYGNIGVVMIVTIAVALGNPDGLIGQDVTTAASSSAAEKGTSDRYLPQQLLGLLHAPEVHEELGLSKQQVQALEANFVKTDGEWFRARNLPEEQQRQTIARIEQRTKQWLKTNFRPEQLTRLQQLEFRAQGVRCLVRPDVVSQLTLDAKQQAELGKLFEASVSAAAKLQQAKLQSKPTDELLAAVQAAAKAEEDSLKSVLRPEQLKLLAKLVGPEFDVSKLQRIYPLAPELIPVANWINSKPLTLQSLRGKVVVLHFYAFQCINCQRNLPHYQKWFDEFQSKDVVILGIQTPETAAERDFEKVRAAAQQSKIAYPILFDVESKNWASWSNTMWPTVYVIDRQGYLRQWWQGELNWNGATGEQQFHDLIAQLVKDP